MQHGFSTSIWSGFYTWGPCRGWAGLALLVFGGYSFIENIISNTGEDLLPSVISFGIGGVITFFAFRKKGGPD